MLPMVIFPLFPRVKRLTLAVVVAEAVRISAGSMASAITSDSINAMILFRP